MAYLYNSSAVYRAIVQATRDPRAMALFAAASTGGFLLFGRGAQAVTDPMTERKKHEIEHRVVNDAEAQRYAQHSSRAVATLFDSLGQAREEDKHHLEQRVAMPGVAWHPGAERRSRRDDGARNGDAADKTKGESVEK